MASLNNVVPLEANLLKKTLIDKQGWDKEDELVLIKSMMVHIGSTDSELRDKLIYGAFCDLVLGDEIEADILSEMLKSCLNEQMLFKGIGESGTDSVFTRSFTSLLIALILHSDNQKDFLSRELIFEVKDQLTSYITLEKDLRGFVVDKGWAHSIAHIADTFDELIKNKKITMDDRLEITNALWNKVFIADYIYIHDEEERIVVPLLGSLKQGLPHKVMQGYIESVPCDLEKQKDQLPEENYWYLYANCKKFLKSFYVKINHESDLMQLQKSIGTCLLKI
ncbi:DUF2785 domain-containing protein [Planococcus sp. CP5-4]|uniref:DUF2785 domain-containing protein n=1 Tax=unclassified Planococcus (in: firmicutes) TaxID=2662419 RepID=UPI001C22D729|nr:MULTISPECIES: DUF2785 domain-containing protein [unclassified Planococcus (in: firmicutes)]MBU9674504.1 DUF2785 domain-containing protein [Planococcus sp. CP5-4_YE]MBV0910135.1 DUF2785 domain-containing protein [Planococcus sp. CP5-4_UN]MBW6064658.1 DUF2785 domain-containing protein [Planococcus sp. CP5-4]